MIASIISDNQPFTENLRSVLTDHDVECSLANVFSVSGALEAIERLSNEPEIIFVAVPPVVERAVPVLEKLKRRTRSKLVAVGSTRDAKDVLRIVHAGSDDYLDEDVALEGQIGDLLDRLERLVKSDSHDGEIITLMSSSGGVGCSVIATNLALALAADHERCCLCDLDLRRGDLGSMLDLKPRHTIIELCANIKKLDRQIFDDALERHDGGVHLLGAPRQLDDVQQITSDGVEKIMTFARDTFPYVVVDLEDFFHREQFRVLQLSQRILFVYRMDFSALRNTRRTLNYMQNAGIDLGKVQLVANQCGRPKELSIKQVESALRKTTTYYVPDDPKTVIQSLNSGVPAFVENNRSKFSRAIRKMALGVTATVGTS